MSSAHGISIWLRNVFFQTEKSMWIVRWRNRSKYDGGLGGRAPDPWMAALDFSWWSLVASSELVHGVGSIRNWNRRCSCPLTTCIAGFSSRVGCHHSAHLQRWYVLPHYKKLSIKIFHAADPRPLLGDRHPRALLHLSLSNLQDDRCWTCWAGVVCASHNRFEKSFKAAAIASKTTAWARHVFSPLTCPSQQLIGCPSFIPSWFHLFSLCLCECVCVRECVCESVCVSMCVCVWRPPFALAFHHRHMDCHALPCPAL